MTKKPPQRKTPEFSDKTLEALEELKNISGIDNIVEFLTDLDDEALGFKSEKTSLVDMLPKPGDEYDFFKQYYNSDAAKKNREFGTTQEERFSKLRNQRSETDDSFLDKILHKDRVELRKAILKNLKNDK